MASQRYVPYGIAVLCLIASIGAGCAAEPAAGDVLPDSTEGRAEAVVGSPIDTMAGIDGSYLRLGLSPRGELLSLRLTNGVEVSAGVVDGDYRAVYRCAPTPCVVEGQYHAVPENPAVGVAHIVLTPNDPSADVDVYVVDALWRSVVGAPTVLGMVLESAAGQDDGSALPFVLFRVGGPLTQASNDDAPPPPAASEIRCSEDGQLCWTEIPAEPSFDGFVTAYTANAFADRILVGPWPGVVSGTARDHRGIVTFDTSIVPDDIEIAFAALDFHALPESCPGSCPVWDWVDGVVFDIAGENGFGPHGFESPVLTMADYYAPSAASRAWEPAPMVGIPILHPSPSSPGSSDDFVALINRDGLTQLRIRTRTAGEGAPLALASSEGAAGSEGTPPTLIVGWSPTALLH